MIEPRYFNKKHIPIIGQGSVILNTLLDCGGQITIGEFVFFGHDCMVLTGSHDYTLRGANRRDTAVYKPVTIKDGVWIASRVTILPGVTIGEDAVIGAGSVVSCDIPAGELWIGNPIRFIKKIIFKD